MTEPGPTRFSSLRPLRHRDYALLFWASAVSNVGTWMQTVAVGALVAARTGRASWAALVAAAAFLPLGVLAPVGGALADRLDRRTWLAAGNVALAALAATLALVSAQGRATPVVVTALTFVAGCVAAITFPFQMAMIPDLVPKEDLLAASSLGSAQYNLGRVVGPALAGALIAATSYTWAFVVNAVSFGAVIAALVVLRTPPLPRQAERKSLLADIKAGVQVATREPGCRAAMSLIAAAAFLVAPFIALIPAKAELLATTAKQTAGITGALTTAQGVGAVTGALLVAPLAGRIGRRRALTLYVYGTCGALALYAYAPSVPASVVAMALVGGLYIGILSTLSTVVQLRAPAEFRARVLSLFFLSLGVVYPVGSLVHGALADRLTLARTTTAMAAGLVTVLTLVAVARPRLLDALDGDEPEVERPIEVPGEAPVPATPAVATDA